nr:hypothetical protein [Tanacetum cinerariifolium]
MYPCFLQLIIRKQVGDLSTHTTKYTSPALTQKVFANMQRVCKGFSGVETPLFEGIAAHGEVPTVAEELSIPSLTPPTLPPQPSYDIPSTSQAQPTPPQSPQRVETSNETVMDDVSNQGKMIADMDADADVVLEEAKEVAEDAKVDESVDIQERKAESQAEIYKIDLEHANKVLSMKEDETELTEVQEVVEVVTTGKIITEVVTAASETIIVASENITAAEAQVHAFILTAAPARAKEDNAVKRYQAMKRKPQAEAQARKNMMVYLKNVVGLKMDYFKGMSYDDICPIFERYFDSNVAFLLKTKEKIEEEESRALKRINETPAEKVAKRKKLDEEVEELKRHLQIVPNEDDDVYTEATPLARKVPVVDYEIIKQNNKLYYKIIRADGTQQLYISFLTLLKNFDRDDLEALWSLVKERFATTMPKNFSDDFLLVTLGAMFEKPDIHAQI